MKTIGRKKLIGIIMAVLVISVVSTMIAGPAFAAWVGGVTKVFTMREPITPPKVISETNMVDPEPGKTSTQIVEIKNTSDKVAYGMLWVLDGYLDYEGRGSPGSTPTKARVQLILTAMAGGFGSSMVRTTMTIDPDGPGPLPPVPYMPGERVNIPPGGTQWAVANVQTRQDCDPGRVVVNMYPDRGIPVPEITPTQAPITAEQLQAQITALQQQLATLVQKTPTPESQNQIAALLAQINSLLARLAEIQAGTPGKG